ncbi:MAG TPA: HAD-IIIA family hydrolase [Capsulimonadaceae bacterium]|nr:HAD-IIIA family hydrolase [Capsulimonadaceae bacterium]
MKEVWLIVFDVDGTLTDGTVHFDSKGREHKRFHIGDGLGFRMAEAAGLRLAIVSGRKSKAVESRMSRLPSEDILQGVGDKASALRDLMSRHDLTPAQVAYVGDDLNDLLAFDAVGVRIAVANAAPELKRRADYITERRGGHGAGRDAIEAVLRAQGRYDAAVAQYLIDIAKPEPGPTN